MIFAINLSLSSQEWSSNDNKIQTVQQIAWNLKLFCALNQWKSLLQKNKTGFVNLCWNVGKIQLK